ncbi:MAG: acylphosphatase, partial [Coriobacteriia bacterium]|nr:acylphosphatase [Coriobacteriia bacterium]
MAQKIHVKGIVQGVGFRPFVYRLARLMGLDGWVLNATDGVHILVEGKATLIDEFCHELEERAPSAAFISSITREYSSEKVEPGFVILSSDVVKGERTLVSPDLATCPDCLAELFDPADRRYRYPFINCTNCGPRFTIINELPYDRPLTSMAPFAMCESCAREYHDPIDRRFHAQPNACFTCGPRVDVEQGDGVGLVQRDGVGLVQRDGVGVPLFGTKSGTPTPSLC